MAQYKVSLTVKVKDEAGEVSTHTVHVPVQAETRDAAAQAFVHDLYSKVTKEPKSK